MWGEIGGSIVGGLFGMHGAKKQNAANAKEAWLNRKFQFDEHTRSMQFNKDQAYENRKWQQMMSSTAYQRAMDDMKAAGLNPILAYKQGGASSPSGATASTGIPSGAQARMENVMMPAVNSAISVGRAIADIERTKAQTAQTKQQTEIMGDVKKPVRNAADLVDKGITGVKDVAKWMGEFSAKMVEMWTHSAQQRKKSMDEIRQEIKDIFTDDPNQGWFDKSMNYIRNRVDKRKDHEAKYDRFKGRKRIKPSEREEYLNWKHKKR
jgi:hypothetical protein